MLPQEQIEQIKKQLISQLEQSNVPNKEEIKNSINMMNAEQLEEFLKKNNLIKTSEGVGGQSDVVGTQPQQCIFCSIISGDIQSYKIDENKNAIAILEINPISKAHTLIIPKEHILSSEKIPQTVFSLAKKIAKKIKTKFKPKDVIISSSNLFGHEIINVLPIYKDETINSQRQQAKPEELEKLQKILEKKTRMVRKPKTKKIEEKLWLPRRIP
jgi:histidine triad (HIT) family protein